MAFDKNMLNYFTTNLWNKAKTTFVKQEDGKGLSTEDYTTDDKNTLNDIDEIVGNDNLQTTAKTITGAINELFGTSINSHLLSNITDDDGVHNIRFNNNTLQIYSDGVWNNISYLPLSGGTITGNVHFANGNTYYINYQGDAKFNSLDIASTSVFRGDSTFTEKATFTNIYFANSTDTYIDSGGNAKFNKLDIAFTSTFMHNVYFANGTTYYVNSEGSARFKDIYQNGNVVLDTSNYTSYCATSEHTHNYAGSSSIGGAATSANKVNTNLVVKLNGGTTEGTNMFTFNGSEAKTINITPASIGASATHSHNYLPLSGGTITGNLTTNGYIYPNNVVWYKAAYSTEIGLVCNWKDGSHHNLVTRTTDGLTSVYGWEGTSSYKTETVLRGYTIRFGCGGNTGQTVANNTIKFDYDGTNVYLRPTVTAKVYLGSGSYRWYGIRLSTAVDVSSDRRLKHDINYNVSDEMVDLVYNAKPVSFKYNYDDNGIKRYGMIAQDLRDYLTENNKDNFGGLTIEDKEQEVSRELDANEDEVTYGIAYEQYIAPLIATVQHQKKQIDKMQEEINMLKNTSL